MIPPSERGRSNGNAGVTTFGLANVVVHGEDVLMRWRIGSVAALAFATAGVGACSGDEGAPAPGGSTSSSSSSSSGTAADGGAKPNATVGCEADPECQSGVCFLGNGQHFCTVRCTTGNAAEVCVAPLTGTCNKQGFCKRD